ncbi:MAG: 30S ribosomal protein S14 [Thermostichales cyanobacterium DRC_bins_46]
MAKKSMIEREKKRQRLVKKYQAKRAELKAALANPDLDPEVFFELQAKLQALPRNSAPVRLHNRCSMTGRPRGFYRHFGLSRNSLREMAHQGLLPGVTKWGG